MYCDIYTCEILFLETSFARKFCDKYCAAKHPRDTDAFFAFQNITRKTIVDDLEFILPRHFLMYAPSDANEAIHTLTITLNSPEEVKVHDSVEEQSE